MDDLPTLRAIIGSLGLFPSEMLAGMLAPCLAADDGSHLWFLIDGAAGVPVAFACCAPERMTSGTWNLLLIAVDPAHRWQGHARARGPCRPASHMAHPTDP